MLGASFAEETVYAPEALKATVARFQEGEVLFLPGSRQAVATVTEIRHWA